MRRVLALSFAAITASTLVALVVLSVVSTRGGNDGDDGGGDGPEAERANKLVFTYVWMMITTVVLELAAWRVLGTGRHDDPAAVSTRFGAGALGGSTLLYANTALVCAFYYWNMTGRRQEEDRRDRYLREDQDDEGRGSLALFVLCLVLAAVYAILSVFVLRSGDAIAAGGTDEPAAEGDAARDSAHAEILAAAWSALSAVELVAVLAALVVSIAMLFGEDAERAREEGDIWNFLVVLVWMALLVLCFLVVGRRALGGTRTASEVEIGAFGGGLLFFSGLTVLLAVLYGSFKIEDRRQDDGPAGSAAFSFLCLFLGIANFVFAIGFIKYRRSIVSTNAYVPWFRNETSKGSYFVRMDKSKADKQSAESGSKSEWRSKLRLPWEVV